MTLRVTFCFSSHRNQLKGYGCQSLLPPVNYLVYQNLPLPSFLPSFVHLLRTRRVTWHRLGAIDPGKTMSLLLRGWEDNEEVGIWAHNHSTGWGEWSASHKKEEEMMLSQTLGQRCYQQGHIMTSMCPRHFCLHWSLLPCIHKMITYDCVCINMNILRYFLWPRSSQFSYDFKRKQNIFMVLKSIVGPITLCPLLISWSWLPKGMILDVNFEAQNYLEQCFSNFTEHEHHPESC